MASPSCGSILAHVVPASNINSVVAANAATLTSVFSEASVAKQNIWSGEKWVHDVTKYHREWGQIPMSQIK